MSAVKSIWIVTQITEYQVDNQWAFLNEADARAKDEELCKSLFTDLLEEAKEDEDNGFTEDSTVTDYQDSSAWWDNDDRVRVTLEEVALT